MDASLKETLAIKLRQAMIDDNWHELDSATQKIFRDRVEMIAPVIDLELDTKQNTIDAFEEAFSDFVEATIHTAEYMGPEKLPPIEGWSWYDVLARHAPSELRALLDQPVYREYERNRAAEAAKQRLRDVVTEFDEEVTEEKDISEGEKGAKGFLHFVDEVPPDAPSHLESVMGELKAHPGKWALIAETTQFFCWWRPLKDDPSYEISTRKKQTPPNATVLLANNRDVYARYIGDDVRNG